jgi:hypothetical protein
MRIRLFLCFVSCVNLFFKPHKTFINDNIVHKIFKFQGNILQIKKKNLVKKRKLNQRNRKMKKRTWIFLSCVFIVKDSSKSVSMLKDKVLRSSSKLFNILDIVERSESQFFISECNARKFSTSVTSLVNKNLHESWTVSQLEWVNMSMSMSECVSATEQVK